jgi:hypothetical protein
MEKALLNSFLILFAGCLASIPLIVGIHLNKQKEYSHTVEEDGHIPVRLDTQLKQLKHDNMVLHNLVVEYEKKVKANERYSKTLEGRLLDSITNHPDKWELYYVGNRFRLSGGGNILIEGDTLTATYNLVSPVNLQLTSPKEKIHKAILGLKNRKIEQALSKITNSEDLFND